MPIEAESSPTESSKWPTIYETGGEILEDGTLIELVQDPQEECGLNLLKSSGGEPVQSPFVEHGDRTYVPLRLHRTLRRALRLPSRLTPYGSVQTLKEELLALTARFIDLPEDPREQLANVILASWVADFLPAPMNVWLWFPSAADGARVLQYLHCLCRLSVLLSGANATDLRALPDKLPATLLILRPASGRRTREWLAASGWRNFYHARSGRLIQSFGAKVLSADAPLGKPTLGPVLEIPITPSRRPLPPLDTKRQREISGEFLSMLLQFRLDYASGKFAEPADVGPSALAGLMEAEADWGDLRLRDPRVVLIEVLLARCHQKGLHEIQVAAIAVDVNAVLDNAGMQSALSARLVGALLKSVGLFTRRLGQSGRGLKLDSATRRAIHRLARLYTVPSANQPFSGCAECADPQATGI